MEDRLLEFHTCEKHTNRLLELFCTNKNCEQYQKILCFECSLRGQQNNHNHGVEDFYLLEQYIKKYEETLKGVGMDEEEERDQEITYKFKMVIKNWQILKNTCEQNIIKLSKMLDKYCKNQNFERENKEIIEKIYEKQPSKKGLEKDLEQLGRIVMNWEEIDNSECSKLTLRQISSLYQKQSKLQVLQEFQEKQESKLKKFLGETEPQIKQLDEDLFKLKAKKEFIAYGPDHDCVRSIVYNTEYKIHNFRFNQQITYLLGIQSFKSGKHGYYFRKVGAGNFSSSNIFQVGFVKKENCRTQNFVDSGELKYHSIFGNECQGLEKGFDFGGYFNKGGVLAVEIDLAENYYCCSTLDETEQQVLRIENAFEQGQEYKFMMGFQNINVSLEIFNYC